MKQNQNTAPVGSQSTPQQASQQKLRSFIERIEHLEDERTGIASEIRDVFAEAKADGFDNRAMREVLKLRKMNDAERHEQEAMLATYLHDLGMAA